MTDNDNVSAHVATARSAMQREWGTPQAAAYAFDGVTVPLVAIADELRRIRKLLEGI